MNRKTVTYWIIAAKLISAHSAIAVGNGEAVLSGDWLAKHTVSLHYRNGAINEMCTGTVLGPRHILTAAHCFISRTSGFSLPKERFRVILSLDVSAFMLGGENNSARKIQLASYTTFSPLAEFGIPGDIAVVKLDGRLPRQYSAVRLEEKNTHLDDDLILGGYGLVSPGSTLLRGTRLTRGILYSSPIPENDAADFFTSATAPFFIHMNSRFDNSVCSGDSGGPVFRKQGNEWVQVGVVHGSTNRTGVHLKKCPNEESYATKVFPYIQWIQSSMRNL